MSRQIDITKPLSDADREYLLARDNRYALEVNAAAVVGAEFEGSHRDNANDDGGAHESPKEVAVEDMTVEQLKTRIGEINEANASDPAFVALTVSGNKEELLGKVVEYYSSNPVVTPAG